MAEIINFNKARKAKQKAEGKAKAADNRAFFGLSSKLRQLQKTKDSQAQKRHEGHRLTNESSAPEGHCSDPPQKSE